MKYAFIREHSDAHKTTRLCVLLEVSPSGYYDWFDRPESNRSCENRALTDKIKYFHQQSNKVYGSPKIHKDLFDDCETYSVNRVTRLMKVSAIKSKMARKFIVTTDSKNTMKPAPDLLKRQFDVDRHKQGLGVRYNVYCN